MEILFQKGQAVNALKHVVVSVKNRTEIKEEEANMTTVRRNVALGGFTAFRNLARRMQIACGALGCPEFVFEFVFWEVTLQSVISRQ